MERSMRKVLSLLLVTTLAVPGCASSRAAQAPAIATAPRPGSGNTTMMADYIRQLPVGSRVRVSRTHGGEIRGTLIRNDADPLIVQRRARIPEAPIEVPLREVVAVEIDPPGNNVARAVAIGAGAAAAATLGLLALLAAIYSD
jgi:hypothetical protein